MQRSASRASARCQTIHLCERRRRHCRMTAPPLRTTAPDEQSPKTFKMVLLNLLTLGLWSKLGRLTHYAFDAVLVSAFLAGMKRSTGLTFKTDRVAGESKEMSKWIDNYLGVGEWVMDQSVAIAGSSGYFERTR
ncbi:uncharacterized protein F5Z01DRAFT_194337 [Emericellopsis atlantica]|uniref:DUF1748-domain-containing protein n=1 Tax=Emericellopsis atlantica TaxID=2614577 RepID=A0A9P7ZVA5_9HYPO|nr:uncharacterized protein F5Z01DRAFT_194337 [Emericellopsis atlantica]KAG9258365.1 hypothetical protein F5Z01DRAFT_194337 [Emericellopsis atlantica]